MDLLPSGWRRLPFGQPVDCLDCAERFISVVAADKEDEARALASAYDALPETGAIPRLRWLR